MFRAAFRLTTTTSGERLFLAFIPPTPLPTPFQRHVIPSLQVAYVAITATGGAIVGQIATPNTTDPGRYESWDRDLDLPAGAQVRVRLLYRRDMFELYVNDYLLPVSLMGGAGSGRVGVLPNVASIEMGKSVRGWSMSLPGTAHWPVPSPAPPPPPPPVPVPAGDLAKGRPTSCQGFFRKMSEYGCDKGADGNLLTRWSSNEPYDGSSRWWMVDLGKAGTSVRSARISWEAAYAKDYQLQASDDMETWKDFFTTTDGKGKVETMEKLSGSGRYIRVLCTARFAGSPWGFSFFEVELFSTPQLPPLF